MGVTMKAKPIMTFREGAVGLSVWQREGKAGIYFDFTLSRCYQGKDGEFSYSNSFHQSNADAMTRVIMQATAWIQQQGQAAGIGAAANGGDASATLQEAYE